MIALGRHDNQDPVIGAPYGDEPFLSVIEPVIGRGDAGRIKKHCCGDLETDTVFLRVCLRLGSVPLEIHRPLNSFNALQFVLHFNGLLFLI